MGEAQGLLISFYGDDFTGSTDAMEFLAGAGLRTVLFLEAPGPEQLEPFVVDPEDGIRAVGVAGLTRAMLPDEMEAEVRPAFSKLRALGAPVVHYKICSTCDSSPGVGSVGRVIDVGADVFRSRFVPLVVGAPVLGRYCVFGNLFARSGLETEPYRLDRHPTMSCHPVTPMDESDLRLHLGRQTEKKIRLFDILHVSLPPDEAERAFETFLESRPDVALFDVLHESQLPTVGRLIFKHASRDEPLFVVGSSGVEMALSAYWLEAGMIDEPKPFPDRGTAGPIVVVSGSCSPVTGRQIDRALGQGFAEVALDTARLAEGTETEAVVREAAGAALEIIGRGRGRGRSVIVHTGRGPDDPRIEATKRVLLDKGYDELEIKTRSGRVFGEALGAILKVVLEGADVGRAVVAGGDTSGYAARTLGIEALEMIGPIGPGAPLCRAYAPDSPADGLEINFKGGQLGRTDHFEAVLRGRP